MNAASSLIGGRFRIGELLGSGGSASVFAAIDMRTGLPVALKILHPHLSERPAARDAFLAEARRAARLRHPNIVAVLDVGVDDTAGGPLAWIALERAAGESLSEHVAAHGALKPGDAAVVVAAVLRALEVAHADGLVHRDVSPSNVMVEPRAASDPMAGGRFEGDGVRLLDFGLADAAGRAAVGTDELLNRDPTGRAGVIGNVNYLSPEQARGDAVDARGDVYQAGALLCFALTGRPPFPRATAGQTMRAHLEAPPPVPSVADPRIPRALDRVVVRAMLKEPSDRFPSAAAMRTALAAAVPARKPEPAAASLSPAPDEARPVPDDVTRVLGRTIVPPRDLPAVATIAAPRPIGRARSRAGTWFALAAAAVVVAVIVVAAASSAPTVSVAEESTPPPASTPAPTAATPVPSPRAEPVVLLPTVPDLTRFTLAEALRALAEAGFVDGEIMRADSPLRADTVLETRPAAGRALAAGEPVSLIVASGANTIPDVAGQGRDAAASMLQAAGFAPSFAYRTAPSGTPVGAILGTDPVAGTLLAVGTPLTVYEAVPAPSPSPVPVHPTSTPTPTIGPGE